MEKSLMDFQDILEQDFTLPESDIRTYSPLTLAYIGDAVYELMIRTVLVRHGNTQVNKLHHHASNLVKAETQSRMIEVMLPDLTEDEMAVYKRGRNAKSYTKAKNATTGDYRRATGFEALIGYLYLKKDYSRMSSLVTESLKKLELE